jgi:N6-L-threonylcarbamoyladenine synthase
LAELSLKVSNKFIRSGGHNLLVLAQDLGQYVQLGTTIDDAIGEAYDKSARWLGLDMRKGGGPSLEGLALEGDPEAVKFRVCFLI